MVGKLNIINPTSFITSLEDYNCGKTSFVELNTKDYEIRYEETRPLAGYKIPINEETGEKFPNCCPSHKNLFQIGLEKFSKFPNCCEPHKKLLSANWFNKDNYSYYPLKFVTTLAYTFHCINKCIETPNWYKEITDYIEYTRQSYGQLPEGYGSPFGLETYLYNIEKSVEDLEGIPKEKRIKLLEFIKNYFKPIVKKRHTDINILINTYKRWLKDFPFELTFFSHLKPSFENQLPILEGKGETNIYTGLTGFKLQSYEGLIQYLVSVTETILKNINTLSLYEQGLITDVDKISMELINEAHRLKLKTLELKILNDRSGYLKLLKQWFKDEKKYIKEITPFIKNLPKQ